MQRLLIVVGMTVGALISGGSMPGVRGQDARPALYVSPGQRASYAVRQLVLVDTEQKKELPVRVSYPTQGRAENQGAGQEQELTQALAQGQRDEPSKLASLADSLPVIVWSHGMYGSKESYQPLVDWWASHGYVVLQPTHSDSISLMSPSERRKLLADFNLNRTEDWPSRPRDVRFLLDSLSSIETELDGLSGRLDRKRIGVGGHSFGAVTAQLVAGTKPRLSEDEFVDGRPVAFVAISPNGDGPFFSKSAMQQIKRPLMVISGDHDQGRLGEMPSWRRVPFDESPPGDKYLLWIKDAHHNFGGISGAPPLLARLMREHGSPSNAEQVELVKMGTLAFWDSYLKQTDEARRFLDTGRIWTTNSTQTAQLEVK